MQRKLLLSLLLSLLPLVLFFFFATPAHALVTIVVNSHSDVINSGDNLCTLREAVIAVNTHAPSGGGGGECPGAPGLNTIILGAGTYTLTIPGVNENNAMTGDLDLKQDMTIQGNGGACAFNSACTLIHAGLLDRAFDITSTVHVTITGLDINWGNEGSGFGGGGISNNGVLKLSDAYVAFNATVSEGGGFANNVGATAILDRVGFLLNTAYRGGAIVNSGTLTITKALFNLDSASLDGGGIYNPYPGVAAVIDSGLGGETAASNGGGIYNDSELILNRVLLSTNKANAGNGGGLYSNGPLSLTNVTLSSNAASPTIGYGGGISNYGTGSLTHVTLYNNTAFFAGAIYGAGPGTSTFLNTIVYSNTHPNCAGGPLVSLGYNIDGVNSCFFSSTGDLTSTNPLLGPLQYNGGWNILFQTHALLPGSPAINRIPNGVNGCGTTITTDQRGYARVSPCDSGAFEYVLRLMLPLLMR